MQADERDAGYLWDMREAVRDCSDFVKDASYEIFSADKMMYSAVERRLEILGERRAEFLRLFKRSTQRFPGKRLKVFALYWPIDMTTLTFINSG